MRLTSTWSLPPGRFALVAAERRREGRRRRRGGGTHHRDHPDRQRLRARLVVGGGRTHDFTSPTTAIHFLRRGYNFTDGLDTTLGQLDAGLFFLAYQRDPRTQFIPMQDKLARIDALNEYVKHLSVWSETRAMHGFLTKQGVAGCHSDQAHPDSADPSIRPPSVTVAL